MPYLEVSFNLPIDAVYTYASAESVPLGCRVQAQLGKRKMTGWVVGHPDRPPEGVTTIRDISRAVDSEPLFDESYLKLARWTADLSLCSSPPLYLLPYHRLSIYISYTSSIHLPYISSSISPPLHLSTPVS